MNKNYYAIIMAGGVGSRFWPVSKESFPKQFHDMLGTGQTLLQKTVSRLESLIPKENILILTNERYSDLVLEQLPQTNKNQIIAEPAMRNTAPCILMASLKIHKQNPEAVMVVAPSDHWIEDESAFISNLQNAFDFSEKSEVLMTLGIKPTFANTGYGYIEYDKANQNPEKKVLQFREKPNYETAKSFLEQGNFLWNGGVFIWSTASVLKAFEMHQPKLYSLFSKGQNDYNTDREAAFVSENYKNAENISVDYALLELSDNVYVIPSEFGWSDLGTWGSLHAESKKDEAGNVTNSDNLFAENTKNCLIRVPNGKLVVIKDLEDFIVVDEDDVLLIHPKSKEQEIKAITKSIKEKSDKFV